MNEIENLNMTVKLEKFKNLLKSKELNILPNYCFVSKKF